VSAGHRVTLLSQAAHALMSLHGQGLLHRDVAARNLLLHWIAGRMTVQLSDFGFSCHERRPMPTEWQPDIWPPEVVALCFSFGFAGDVFAFGLMLADVLNGGVGHGRLVHAVVATSVSLQIPFNVDAFVTSFEDGDAWTAVPPSDDDQFARVFDQVVAQSAEAGSGSWQSSGRVRQSGTGRTRLVNASRSAKTSSGSIASRPLSTEEKAACLDDWRMCRSLIDPATVVPALSLLIEWCTHAAPSQRPSMRMVTCLLRLLSTRSADLSALPDLFMAQELATAPDSPADWRLISQLWWRSAVSLTLIAWAGLAMSEAAVEAVVDVLPVRMMLMCWCVTVFLSRLRATRVCVLDTACSPTRGDHSLVPWSVLL